jgi:hypothetical protein
MTKPPSSSDEQMIEAFECQYGYDAHERETNYYRCGLAIFRNGVAYAQAALQSPPQPVEDNAGKTLSRQQIYDKFSFLEGLVNERTYREIAEAAIKIQAQAIASMQPVDSSDVVEKIAEAIGNEMRKKYGLGEIPFSRMKDTQSSLLRYAKAAIAAMQPCAGMGEDEAVEIMIRAYKASPFSGSPHYSLSGTMRHTYRALLAAMNGSGK